jgi:hypothetical protein
MNIIFLHLEFGGAPVAQPVILATWEAKIRRIAVSGQPR